MNDKKLTIVKEYLAEQSTSKAILISGKWGAGKTFICEKDIYPIINATRLPNSLKVDKTAYYQPAYISLYGVRDVNDVREKLFNVCLLGTQTNNGKLKTLVKLASRLGRKETLLFRDEDFLTEYLNLGKRVIIFDDLERCSSDVFQDNLGLINYLSEVKKLKVIVLANQDKLNKDHNWEEVKEKLVSEQISISPDKNTIKQLIGSLVVDTNCREYLKSNISVLHDALILSDSDNLRSLIAGIMRFEKVFLEIRKEKKYSPLLSANLLYSIMITMFEYKKGSYDLSIQQGVIKINNYYISKGSLIEMVNKNSPNSESQSYNDKFYNAYLKKQDYQFQMTSELFQFVIEGIFDTEILRSLSLEYPVTEDAKPENIAVRKLLFLSDYPMEVEDFDYNLNLVLECIHKGAYRLDMYVRVFDTLRRLIEYGLLELSIETLKEKILDSIEIHCSSDQFIASEHLGRAIKSQSDIKESNAEEIRTVLEAKNAAQVSANNNNSLSKIISELKNGSIEDLLRIIYFKSERSISHPAILYDLDLKDFTSSLLKVPNKKISEITAQFALRCDLETVSRRSISFYKTLSTELTSVVGMAKKTDKLKCFYLEEMNRLFQNIIIDFEPKLALKTMEESEFN